MAEGMRMKKYEAQLQQLGAATAEAQKQLDTLEMKAERHHEQLMNADRKLEQSIDQLRAEVREQFQQIMLMFSRQGQVHLSPNCPDNSLDFAATAPSVLKVHSTCFPRDKSDNDSKNVNSDNMHIRKGDMMEEAALITSDAVVLEETLKGDDHEEGQKPRVRASWLAGVRDLKAEASKLPAERRACNPPVIQPGLEGLLGKSLRKLEAGAGIAVAAISDVEDQFWVLILGQESCYEDWEEQVATGLLMTTTHGHKFCIEVKEITGATELRRWPGRRKKERKKRRRLTKTLKKGIG